MELCKKMNMLVIPVDATIPLLGKYPKEGKDGTKYIYSKIFIALWFVVAKS